VLATVGSFSSSSSCIAKGDNDKPAPPTNNAFLIGSNLLNDLSKSAPNPVLVAPKYPKPPIKANLPIGDLATFLTAPTAFFTMLPRP